MSRLAREHRDKIRDAFQRHNIQLGANTLLAPSAVLAGAAPKGRAAAVGAATKKDVADRLGASRGAKLECPSATELGGHRFAQVVHTQRVAPLRRGQASQGRDRGRAGAGAGRQLRRTGRADGSDAGGRLYRTEGRGLRESARRSRSGRVRRWRQSCGADRPSRGAVGGGSAQTITRETHRVKSVPGLKTLERVRVQLQVLQVR